MNKDLTEDIIDSITNPNRIVLYKCPKGHVTGIPFKDYQSGKVKCSECDKQSEKIEFVIENMKKILSE